ncbi:glycosyltransferase [Enterococcus faecium]|uniref:Glycosyltransferase n=3 Tax=Enterococcus faecium TaxID=1352 RepID=A0A3F3NSW4_ENTFC|nr:MULTISPECIES: glycosyltransferase [Enterococcus]EGP5266367.1 glycosyltransferase [Enterococcus faecium]ELZ1274735.1 glycosyltransferase [Enterococcus faecium]EME8099771.1 glycosyltransferase [Enterococcus faecium]EOG04385.1 hypothetical protein SKQ_01318 [Enterococcus faecium EnGen0171]EOK13314.1 hypothetical protein WOY_01000 [Enterococcus faecium EnGen0372]
MKIVHIHQFFDAGFGYQENILPEYHKDMGNDVVMLTSTRKYGFDKNQSRIEPEGEFIENTFVVKRLKIKGEFPKRFVIFDNLYQALEKENPDYIFHHSVTAPSILTVAKYKKRYPNTILVMDNHADLMISGRNYVWRIFYYNFLWKLLLNRVSPYVDQFFGVTPDRSKFLIEELGISPSKVSLLPIGADVKRIPLDEEKIRKDKSTFLKEHNLSSDTFIFCHGGKMSYSKETDVLIHGFMKVEEKNIILLLFGTFLDEELADLISNDNRIIFLGWQDRANILKILSFSDMGIWNSQHTTLLEDAIACKLPLILKKYGSTEHLINKNGIFLEKTDKNSIKKNIEKVINNEELFKSMIGEADSKRNELSYEKIAFLSLNYKNITNNTF